VCSDKTVEPTLDLPKILKPTRSNCLSLKAVGPALIFDRARRTGCDPYRSGLRNRPVPAYLDVLREVNPDELTDFLVVAAKLILIKSQVLLPRPPPGVFEEEEEDIGDELARQLLAYKQFKQVAAELQSVEERAGVTIYG